MDNIVSTSKNKIGTIISYTVLLYMVVFLSHNTHYLEKY